MKLAWICFLIRDIKIEMKPSPRIYQGLNLIVTANILTTSCHRAADPAHSRSSPTLHSELHSHPHCIPSWFLIIILRLAACQTGHSLTQNIFTPLPFSFLGPWWWSTICLWNISDLLGLRSSHSGYVNHLTVQAIGPSPDLSQASLPRENEGKREAWWFISESVIYWLTHVLHSENKVSSYLSICYTHCI